MRADVADDDVVWLWPENLEVWHAWLGVQTQWRVGMAGATGLDYAGVDAALRMSGIRGERRREAFGLLQLMERAALAAWAERQSR